MRLTRPRPSRPLAPLALALALAAPAARGEDPACSGAPTPATVRLGIFSASLPVQAATARGFFAAEQLTVEPGQVKSSQAMYKDLLAGGYDVVISSVDNPVNYRLNPHNASGAAIDAQVLFGADLGMGLALVAQKGLGIEQLRGKDVALDAPDSGFAYVLYALLVKHGLEKDRDYRFVAAGGTPIRLAGLRKGAFQATLLSADSIVRARNEGFPVLATAADVADPYLGSVGVARQAWLEKNPCVAIRFLRAYHRGNAWVLDPANRDAVVALLTDAATPPALAAQIYELARSPSGLVPDMGVSRAGLLRVLELRKRFGGFEAPQDLDRLAADGGGLVELSWLRRATGEGGRGRRN